VQTSGRLIRRDGTTLLQPSIAERAALELEQHYYWTLQPIRMQGANRCSYLVYSAGV